MAKKTNKDELEKQKALLILRSAYQMHLKTREETVLRGKESDIELVDTVLAQTLEQMAKIDPDFARETYKKGLKDDKSSSFANYSDSKEDVFSAIKDLDKKNEVAIGYIDDNSNDSKLKVNEDVSIFEGVDPDNMNFDALADEIGDIEYSKPVETEVKVPENQVSGANNEDSFAVYDIIPLPSKGECYRHKKDKVKVGYLTASDENIITSPNLYESGDIMNILLKRKVLDKDVNVDELVSGDVDAIMVWLRGTAYGNEFPFETTIPGTTRTIKTSADLSKLNYKPFSLSGDENGHFKFVLPRTKAEIKFKFLTKKEERLLQKLNKRENNGIASIELKEAVEKVKKVIKSDTTLSSADKNTIIDASQKLEKWSDSLSSRNNNSSYTKSVTNTMEMQIVSINGNEDRRYIHEFVNDMPASDSLAFRRYIYDNQPGVDFEIKVEKPESLGGGSFSCFLEWDDYVFWAI